MVVEVEVGWEEGVEVEEGVKEEGMGEGTLGEVAVERMGVVGVRKPSLKGSLPVRVRPQWDR
jgi:hypothetical protein